MVLAVTVDIFIQFMLRDDASTIPDQMRNQPVLQRRERNGHAAERHLHLSLIQYEIAMLVTDEACPAERRTIERSRASNSSMRKGLGR